jgi:cysteine desulfurase / selenocysteine lyase
MSTEPNWNEIRNQFPATKNATYFVSAAVGPFSTKVFEAYQKHIKLMYEHGDLYYMDSFQATDDSRALLAQMLGGSVDDYGFGPNTSHNMNILAMMLKSEGTGNIVAPADEFPSSILPWYHHGFEVRQVPSDNGRVSNERILDQVDENTKAVVHSAVQFSTGYRQDVNSLGRSLHEKKTPFIVNATQSLSVFPLSVEEAKVSAVTASCHKWVGAGYGASILYVCPEWRQKYEWPLAGWLSVEDPSSMANEPPKLMKKAAAIETGVMPYTTIIGLRAALELALELGVENIAKRVLALSNLLEEQLKDLPVKFLTARDSQGALDSCNSGILVLQIDDPQALEDFLKTKNIFVNARRTGVRIAIHYFNNEEDIQKLVAALKEYFTR